MVACGIGRGDEVIVQANGFVADVEAVIWTEATPVLVDAEEESFGPDPEAVERAITPKTKAVLAVHMYGHPCKIGELLDICERHGLILIEDAAHAHGALYRGRKVGTFGKVGCFSCGVVKNLNALGDAGLVITNDEEVAHRLKFLRVHGQVKKNEPHFYGFNCRLDELQAVVLRARLKKLDEKNRIRRQIADFYRKRLSHIKELRLPPEDKKGNFSVYHRFMLFTPKRDSLQKHLKEKGIGTGLYYPIPLHLQPAWKNAGLASHKEGDFPVAERLCSQGLAIPLFPEMTQQEMEKVVQEVEGFFS